VPYAPGGVSDIAARLVGQKLTEALGHHVIVENRPGGNGFVAILAAVKALPDGYGIFHSDAWTAYDLRRGNALIQSKWRFVRRHFEK
jgi:Tripartite tricarboxylate transporter family receptor